LRGPLKGSITIVAPDRSCRYPIFIPAFASKSKGFLVISGSAARRSETPEPLPGAVSRQQDNFASASHRPSKTQAPLTILVVVPTLQSGAAEMGALELVRNLTFAGHKVIVLSSGGRLERDIATAGGEFVRADVASKNPIIMTRNATLIARIVRERRCDAIHAHGRAPAWSAYAAAKLTRVPFVTSWYKGFREQNAFKRIYNGVMARGDRIVAVSEQIAELVSDRYRVPWEKIAVIPASVDLQHFDPASISPARIDAIRRSFGVRPDDKVILIAGRILRRKGHHIVVRAAHRLKEMGCKDFVCVLVGEDHENSRYAGELWDQVLATDTADVVRLIGPVDDMPAAYMASMAVVSAATQEEGLQHTILEAQAMERPVIVSDLGAGPDIVLAPPSVPEDRMTGLRFAAGDDEALAATLIRLFSMPESWRRGIGQRGREWVSEHFNAPAVAEMTLKLYSDVVQSRKSL
jgi:glycosyltransferase involved in cell wall biosynthesis